MLEEKRSKQITIRKVSIVRMTRTIFIWQSAVEQQEAKRKLSHGMTREDFCIWNGKLDEMVAPIGTAGYPDNIHINIFMLRFFPLHIPCRKSIFFCVYYTFTLCNTLLFRIHTRFGT